MGRIKMKFQWSCNSKHLWNGPQEGEEFEGNFWQFTPVSEHIWKQIPVTMQPYAGTYPQDSQTLYETIHFA